MGMFDCLMMDRKQEQGGMYDTSLDIVSVVVTKQWYLN